MSEQTDKGEAWGSGDISTPAPVRRDAKGRWLERPPNGGRRRNAGSSWKEHVNYLETASDDELRAVCDDPDQPGARVTAARLWLILRSGPVIGERGSRREYLDALRTLIDYTDGKPVERHEIRTDPMDTRHMLEDTRRMLADAGYPTKQIEARIVAEQGAGDPPRQESRSIQGEQEGPPPTPSLPPETPISDIQLEYIPPEPGVGMPSVGVGAGGHGVVEEPSSSESRSSGRKRTSGGRPPESVTDMLTDKPLVPRKVSARAARKAMILNQIREG